MGILFRGLLKSPPDEIDAAQLDGAMQKAAATWSMLDARLARHPFVAGDALTMGDIALGNAVHRWFTLPRARPNMSHIEEWYARLGARQAYRQHISTV
jgi:glutathione S-transferase